MGKSKKERIRAVLSGGTPDRAPVSIWGHDFLREWCAEDLANQTIEKQRQYDYDFIKLNPRWTFLSEVWGNTYQPPTEQVFPRLLRKRVEKADDFFQIEPAETSHPVLEEHLRAVELVIAQTGEEVDLIYTLFSPLAVAGLLCGGIGEPLTKMAGENPKAVHHALEVLAESLREHVSDVLEKGAAGLFYAPLQWTSTRICDSAFYAEFGEPYDLVVLRSVEKTPFNVLHVCGDHVELERFLSYPVQVLNWDDSGPGNPSLSHVHASSDKVVAGGIPHRKIQQLDFEQLKAVAEASVGSMKDRVMLTGGCAVGALLDPERRRFVREIAETLRFQ